MLLIILHDGAEYYKAGKNYLKKLGCKMIDFFLERPIVSKNIYYAGIITGIVMNYSKNARISRLNAYF